MSLDLLVHGWYIIIGIVCIAFSGVAIVINEPRFSLLLFSIGGFYFILVYRFLNSSKKDVTT